jgi:predicted metal-binding membrane protein
MQSGDTALTELLKRDRVLVAAALAVLTLLAWAYVLWLRRMAMHGDACRGAPGGMGGMDRAEWRWVGRAGRRTRLQGPGAADSPSVRHGR